MPPTKMFRDAKGKREGDPPSNRRTPPKPKTSRTPRMPRRTPLKPKMSRTLSRLAKRGDSATLPELVMMPRATF
jgi:hypothetical protein